MKQQLVVVGAGVAYKQHYKKTIKKLCEEDAIEFLGIVDPEVSPQSIGTDLWLVPSIADIPNVEVENVAALVLTPDHFSVILELAQAGFKKIIVEKPLVSRDDEISKLQTLVERRGLLIYAIDFYIPKCFPLAIMTGIFDRHDFQADFVTIEGLDNGLVHLLGEIEGISVQVIESGDFCLPDLEKRPWLENDREIGGMLRDLGTHALSPLVAAGMINSRTEIHQVEFSKIGPDRRSLVPLTDEIEVEMYVSALLVTLLAGKRIPVSLAFGKVPFNGGIWSLEVRGSKGMFFAGLRTGQSAVFVPTEGPTMRFSLNQSTYRIVLKEAFAFFDGALDRFDGNIWAFTVSMGILKKMRKKYFPHFST